MIELVCILSYGLKQMGGINRLSGPGTEAEEEPGMMQGGGKWPNRLGDFSITLYCQCQS